MFSPTCVYKIIFIHNHKIFLVWIQEDSINELHIYIYLSITIPKQRTADHNYWITWELFSLFILFEYVNNSFNILLLSFVIKYSFFSLLPCIIFLFVNLTYFFMCYLVFFSLLFQCVKTSILCFHIWMCLHFHFLKKKPKFLYPPFLNWDIY